MKVFNSLLVFSLVAVAASSAFSAVRDEQKLKEGIARIDKAIEDFQREIAQAKVKFQTAAPAEKAKLNNLIFKLNEQIVQLSQLKKKMEALLWN